MKALWLAYLTVREAIVKGTLLFFFIVSNLVILFFIFAVGSITEDGVTSITILGAPVTPRGIPDFDAAEFLFLQLFRNSTFWVMLFGIFATAGLIPSMLEKGTVELYLSKPLSRTSILLARSVGACTGIVLNLMYFSLAIWIIVGSKAGIWHQGFLLASAVTIPIFFFFYSVVAFTALVSRSAGFSIMFSLLFWFFTSALDIREQVLYPWWDNVLFHRLLDALFYATPQISRMVESAGHLIGTDIMTRSPASEAGFDILPFLFSALSSAFLYALSSWYFSRRDY